MRADVYLTSTGKARSRTKAAELIEGGFVTVNGKVITKSSAEVTEEDTVAVTGSPYNYVSRGGVKLEGALDRFGINPDGKIGVDIGASTGGFTDCLLQRGAVRVYAVDSGHEQLDEALKSNPAVKNIEGYNARDLDTDIFDGEDEKADIIVSDVSFISQCLIIPHLKFISHEGTEFISLIKPQFECGPSALNKNGIVKDRKNHISAIEKVLITASDEGFEIRGLMKSTIEGGDGNTEYLYYAVYNGKKTIPGHDIIRGIVYGQTEKFTVVD